VGLAEADAPVDEQRVVGPPRILGDLDRGSSRELVALALDEIRERELGVQPAAELGEGIAGGCTGKPMPAVIWVGVGSGWRLDPISTVTCGTGAGISSSTSSLMRAVQFWFTQSTT
jgi:hypothetical protein